MANLAFARAFNLRAPKLLSKIFAHACIRAKIDILDIEDTYFCARVHYKRAHILRTSKSAR